ncbi:S-layer homology domain-containing protein [Metasolibacillus sp.]|uniref:S-layer homology domain-containing protein n=1 Tax=Metasolibacillus sp. TaxID=2703680 RepID=UPI0025D9552F|nr:S-layer homology domain-containing protein [Metasolibacillus sp.]MCT6922814.1 S-layer homology domain-containing protein [Metasolibacillus sp.]MCT6938847.1 S-layer homology domain-containing protein [Metasolibacillus sp.]
MHKKLFIAALAASIALPAIVVPVSTEAATYSKTFKDVSKSSPYYDSIHTMTEKGIISGYEDGTFKPNETLTRKHAAALLNRAVSVKATKNVDAPKDLPKTNAYYNDLMKLVNAGLLDVDAKGNINPNASLTRGEMAKILATAFNLKGAKHPLTDVSSKYNSYVAALYENDVTTGYEDKTFKEKGSLTRAHYAVFMYRAMGLEKAGGDIAQKPTTPSKKITMSSTEKEINEYIKSSPLFKKGIDMPLSLALKEYYGFKKVIVNAEDILKNTNLKVTKFSVNAFHFNNDNWKSVDRLLGAQVIYESAPSNRFQNIAFDYTQPDSQIVAKSILSTVFGEDFDTEALGRMIDEKVAEGLEKRNQKVFDNIEHIEMGKYKIRLGVDRNSERDHFWMDIEQ